METYNGILAIAGHDYYHVYSDGCGKGEVVSKNFVSYETYRKQAKNGKIRVLRKGGGDGAYVLIEVASLPKKYKQQIYAQTSAEEEIEEAQNLFFRYLQRDSKAFEFMASYRFEDGSRIPTDRIDNITLWSNNAAIMNAISEELKAHKAIRRTKGKKENLSSFYRGAAKFVRSARLADEMQHNAPTNERTLQRKHKQYMEVGYDCLVKKQKGNKNAMKITDELLSVFVDLASHPTNPYITRVLEMYYLWQDGLYDIVNQTTGEFYAKEDYRKDGKVIKVSEGALKYHLNKPAMQVIIDRRRLGFKDYNDLHRPHRHRVSPLYAMSKLSFDDRDLVFKAKETSKRVKAYYAYDVMSGCRVGTSYSHDKNEQLFLDCLWDTMVFCEREANGLPLEVEFEHHLVKQFEPQLKQMFPFVHFCAPSNSQEKRAEHFNRRVKYGVEKNKRPGIGRWWLKSKYNRIGVDKVNDEFKETLKPMDRLIADDIQDTINYNNMEHPKFPGMTRLEVFKANLNPNLPSFDRSYLCQYIGYNTATSIQRNMYISVQGDKYILPTPQVLNELDTNDREVTAYWLPSADSTIDEVYMYQGTRYICTCERLERYNEALAERTDADLAAKLKQDKYVAQFDKMVKDGLLHVGKVELMKVDQDDEIEEVEVVEVVDEYKEMENSFNNSAPEVESYSDKAMRDMIY